MLAGLDPRDRLLLVAVDELHADAFVSDATWHALGQDLSSAK